LTTVMADDSIIAQMLAIDGTVADYDDNDHSQEAISVSGVTDWTSAELNQIRYMIGIDGTTAVPATNRPHIAASHYPNEAHYPND